MLKNFLDILLWTLTKREQRYRLLRKKGVTIGEGCEIYREVNFGSEPYLITIGNNVRITSGVKFCTHDGGMWTLRKMKRVKNADKFGKISIGNNVHIGWNAVIMPGVRIGNNCIVGCGAVVTKNVPDGTIVAGVPARVVRSIEEYYDINKEKIIFTSNMNRKKKQAFLKINMK